VIVDAHAHVFLPAAQSPRGIDALAPAEREATIRTLTATMSEHGVDAAVLVPLDAHDDYVAGVLGEHPGRFAAVAVADDAVLGRGTGDPLRALRARRGRFGFHALRTGWLGEPGPGIAHSPFLPVLRHLAAAEVPLWSYLPPEQLPLLEEALAVVPELTVVLNHLGFCPVDMQVDRHRRPWFAAPFPEPTRAALRRLARHPRSHVMFSGQYALSRAEPPYRDLRDVVDELADLFGARRMLWASDFPWPVETPGYGALLNLPAHCLPGASQAELSEILGGTACRLFPHLRPTT
jgi:predicted TIM-barrel fold metal-dependent hydrolase